MESKTKFHNEDNVGFQGGHQTFNTESIVINNNQSKRHRDVSKEFLSSTAFPTMFQRRDNISEPHTDTCRWILGLEEYQRWIDAPRGLLWSKGKPGAGKSTLMAFLYQQIMKPETTGHELALEFFFNARGEELQHTPLGMLRSLINQLYRKDPHVRPRLDKLYQDKCDAFGGEGTRWDWQQPELEMILRETIVASAQRQPLIVFVDALDEAGSERAQDVAKYFHRINETIAAKSASGKICISCRHYPILSSKHATEITVENHNHRDITAYVQHHLRLDVLLSTNSSDYLSWDSVIDDLIHSANGVFQWASLVVPLVEKRIRDGQSPESTREFLQKVPKGLEEVYGYILRNVIEVDSRSRAYLLFLWVSLAERPLSLTEMRYAISARDIIDSSPLIRCDETPNFPKDDEQMKRQIKALSGGLVEVVENETAGDSDSVIRVAQVVHQSVHDYILPGGLFLLASLDHKIQGAFPCNATELSHENIIQHCHGLMYYSCLLYLVTDNVEIEESDAEMVQDTWPFSDYAMEHMDSHATKAGEYRSGDLEKEILLLNQLLCEKHHRPCSCVNNHPVPSTILLYFASAAGLPGLVDRLLSKGASVDEKDREGDTPLHIAVQYGNATTAKLLLDAGADVNVENLEQETPSTCAATRGHKEIMGMFLAKGFGTRMSGDALHAASLSGRKEIVQLLLDARADVNIIGGKYGTALQAASHNGHTEIVKLLLNTQADVNIISGKYGTALQAASNNGDTKTVQLLLNTQADVNIIGGKYGTALQAASYHGFTDIIQLLVDTQADVNIIGGKYGTALQAASNNGDIKTVQLLLNTQADVNIIGGKYGTALQAASYQGFTDIIQLLVDKGADINIISGEYGTALLAAAQGRQHATETLRFVLSRGADPSIPAQDGQTLAHIAARRGLSDIITIIRPDSVLLSKVDRFKRTPLHLAVYYGHLELADSLSKCLRQHPGMDIYGKTPLDWASQDQAMLEKLHERWPLYTPISSETRINVLRESVRKLVEDLPHITDGWISPGLFELGRCLMFLAMPEDARAVFSMMTSLLHPIGLPKKTAYCHACLTRYKHGPRYICETCAEVELCRACMRIYPHRVTLRACQKHTFLEIPFQECTRRNCISSEEFKAWLQEFLVRFEEGISKKAGHEKETTNVWNNTAKKAVTLFLGYNFATDILLGSCCYLLVNVISSGGFQEWLQDFFVHFERESSIKATYGNENTGVESNIMKNTLIPVLRYGTAVAVLLGLSFYLMVNVLRQRPRK